MSNEHTLIYFIHGFGLILPSNVTLKAKPLLYSFFLLISGYVWSGTNIDDEFYIVKDENIGGLRIDLPASKVNEIMRTTECKVTRGAETIEEASGNYIQDWDYKKCGIRIVMASEKKGDPKKVDRITVKHPCDFSTKRGIHIGSSEGEVIKAYKKFWNKDSSEPGRSFLAGSEYGGLLFNFKGGKVSEIFLGAMAE